MIIFRKFVCKINAFNGMVQKGFRFQIFYQPSMQIIVDFLRIYREIFSIFVIMFFMIKKPEKIFKNK